MSVVFKPGQAVKQIVKPIEGTVKRFSFNPDTGEIQYVIGWTDENGEHERPFKADELEPGT